MTKTRDPIHNPVPTAFDFLLQTLGIGATGTISYIALAAGTTGWMMVGTFFAFAAIIGFINFLFQFF